MEAEKMLEIIGADFYTGVPDSQLRPLCDFLMENYGIDYKHHVIASNEGNCAALAAGYYLATGKVPVVYMQNSGEGNIINPVLSLLRVYAIPIIFIIGWRGEPGIYDEPQHIYQGKITIKLLEDMDIQTFIVSRDTTEQDMHNTMNSFQRFLIEGKSVAFIVRKDAIYYKRKIKYRNTHILRREEVIEHILEVSEGDPIVCTTGKASRELFELRESKGQSHKYDFLTVGSMGHSSSIALGIACQKSSMKIWCIDGDGAVLMHMGSLAVIGANKPENLIHVVVNNGAHETVGGMPTVAGMIDLAEVAKACGYSYAVSVDTFHKLDIELKAVKRRKGLCMIEVKCAIGARDNLGRPTTTPVENKNNFMEYLKGNAVRLI